MCDRGVVTYWSGASSTSVARRARRHVVVPEGVGALAVALPPQAEVGERRAPRATEPLAVDVVGRHAIRQQPGYGRAVQPRLDGAGGAVDLELDAVPGAGRQRRGLGDAGRALLRQGGVVR